MISLQFTGAAQIPDSPTASRLLEEAALATLNAAGAAPDSGLSIVVSDDAQLQELNRQYLGIDAPTDVLSFPADETDPDSGETYLGDILISYPQAAAQAEAGGHLVLDELKLLAVHGTLHLLGYDHGNEDDQARMWQIQAQVLERLGSSILGPASPPG